MSMEMYALNKKIHGQQLPQATDAQTLPFTIDEGAVIQGTDPGLVTTASSIWCSSLTLFQSINRFQVLEGHSDTVTYTGNEETYTKFEMTTNKINNTVLYKKRKQRQKTSLKKRQKGRAAIQSRVKKCHQNLVAGEAKSAATLSIFNKPKRVSFIGNWHRNAQYIRGYSTRSLKPYLSALSTTSTVRLVDEYNSTKFAAHASKKHRNNWCVMTKDL